jgi:lysophospholipase L1-like esterase
VAGSGIGVTAAGTSITITNTEPGSPYTLPDATTTSTGGALIDHPPTGSHPIALTQNSQGHIYTAQLPAGSVDVDPTVKEGDLLYRHPPSSVVVGFIGDSITLNTPSGGNPPPANVATDLTGGGFTVTANNQGIGSTTSADWTPSSGTGDYTAAKAAFLAAGVTVVHIMLGTNDSKNIVATTQAAYKSNLAAICADLIASGIVCVLSYPPYAVPGSLAGEIDAASLTLLQAYQTAIDQLVNGTTIRQGDVAAYSYFSTHTSELSDGVHPTATGSADLAALWAAALSPIVTAPLARLPIGTSGQVLTSNGLDPYWATASSGTELLVTDGITNPPESLWLEDGSDWIYADA